MLTLRKSVLVYEPSPWLFIDPRYISCYLPIYLRFEFILVETQMNINMRFFPVSFFIFDCVKKRVVWNSPKYIKYAILRTNMES